ncbi:MAG: sulfurtransferase [Bacteroidota bacterium]
MKEIVSAEWLNKNLDNPNLVLLDASMDANTDESQNEKAVVTIPSARKFDLKNVFRDKSNPFPNTVPQPEEFELECQKIGINKDSEIIVFDKRGIYLSPRVWWLFNVMGHKNIAVLDGGLPNWMEEGFPITDQYLEEFESGNFKANFDKDLVIGFQQVKENIKQKDFTIVDARSNGRFNGTESEPRKHLKSGSIENSVNIHFQEVLSNGKFKSKEELNELFMEKLKGEKELVFSCGSGITACIIMLAAQIGYGESKKIYDGSWTEWAEKNKLTTS